jgi:acyl transferase domain-containing protein
MLFVISAKTPSALESYLHNYVDFCSQLDERHFHSLCYTTCVGRDQHRHRFACVARSLTELRGKLNNEISSLRSSRSSVVTPHVVFGFPGQGAQYRGMACDLSQRYSGFRTIVLKAANAATRVTSLPVLAYLMEDSSPPLTPTDDSHLGQVCTFVYQFAMYQWLSTLGVRPEGVIGHSLGEISAAGRFLVL